MVLLHFPGPEEAHVEGREPSEAILHPTQDGHPLNENGELWEGVTAGGRSVEESFGHRGACEEHIREGVCLNIC